MSYSKSLEMLAYRDKQLRQLAALRRSGEYVAAGLTFNLFVGAQDEEAEPAIKDIEIVRDQELFLTLLENELKASRAMWRASLQADLDAAATYLKENDDC